MISTNQLRAKTSYAYVLPLLCSVLLYLTIEIVQWLIFYYPYGGLTPYTYRWESDKRFEFVFAILSVSNLALPSFIAGVLASTLSAVLGVATVALGLVLSDTVIHIVEKSLDFVFYRAIFGYDLSVITLMYLLQAALSGLIFGYLGGLTRKALNRNRQDVARRGITKNFR